MYASESLNLACTRDFDYRTGREQELPLIRGEALQKNEVRITRGMSRRVYLSAHVAARDVRTVCHELEKIRRAVPTKLAGCSPAKRRAGVLLEALRGKSPSLDETSSGWQGWRALHQTCLNSADQLYFGTSSATVN